MSPPASRRPPKAPTAVVTAGGKTVQLLGKPKKQHTVDERLPAPPKEVRPKKLYGGQRVCTLGRSTIPLATSLHCILSSPAYVLFLSLSSSSQDDAKTAAHKEAAKKSEAAKQANANRIDRTALPTFMAAGAQQPLANLSRKELQGRAIAAGLKANAKSAEIIKGMLLLGRSIPRTRCLQLCFRRFETAALIPMLYLRRSASAALSRPLTVGICRWLFCTALENMSNMVAAGAQAVQARLPAGGKKSTEQVELDELAVLGIRGRTPGGGKWRTRAVTHTYSLRSSAAEAKPVEIA